LVRFVKRFVAGALIVLLLLAIPVVVTFIILTKDVQSEMSSVEDRLIVADSNPSVILAADGSELLKISEMYRKPFSIDDVPPMVLDAFVAAEDRRFWTHSGVDPIGLLRAAFVSAKDRRASQGGSTMTMQIAKQLVNGGDKTPERKARDIVLALELEKRKTKKQLLELYLKLAYFGEGAFGLASAADVYFGKEINQLTLSEAAMLARCVRRPSDQNPEVNYRKALLNRDVVLGIMKEEGMITNGQYKDAVRDRPAVKTTRYKAALAHSRAPYFVDHVLKVVRDEFPDIDLKKGGYRIETTLQPDVQQIADNAVRETVAQNRASKVTAGAFILIDRNGGILAEVGGQDYSTQKFNVATSGTRQPGSSFKPIVYSAALATGVIKPGQMISNAPISMDQGPGQPPWQPQNGGKNENAPFYSIDRAIAKSINRPALHVYFDTGREVVVDYAHKVFGLTQDIPPVASLPLGVIAASPMQMAEVYSVFALGGDRVEPSPLKRIIGPDGTLLKDYRPVVARNVLNADVVKTMDGYLRGVVTSGTGYKAMVVPEARGKTGTTNDHRDAWFCGYSNGLIGVAWVGNVKSNSPMSSRVYGGVVSVQFWTAVMKYAVPKYGTNPAAGAISVHSQRAVMNPESPEATKVGDPAVNDSTKANPDDPNLVDPSFGDPITPEPDPAGVPPTPDITKGGGDPSIPQKLDPEKSGAKGPIQTASQEKAAVGTTAPPANRKETSRTVPKEEMIDVELCADTGDLASRYCPSTVTRRYPKSKVPRRVCREHGG